MSDAQDLADKAKGELMPFGPFSRSLEELISRPDSPFTHVHARLKPLGELPEIQLGTAGVGNCDHRDSLFMENTEGTFTVDFWANDNAVDKRAVSQVVAAIGAFWADERRTDEHTRLIGAKSPGTKEAAAETVRQLLNAGNEVAVMFADLDHLGSLNAKHQEPAIDEVLGELAGVLAGSVPEDALALHRSGDEFFVICPGPPERALTVSHHIQRAIESHDFSINDDVAMSVGIYSVRPHDSWRTFKDLEKRAEGALKPKPQEGEEADKIRRGRTSLVPDAGGAVGLELDEDGARMLAQALVKSCADEESPFENPWLNFLSQGVHDAFEHGLNCLGEGVAALIEWMDPDPATGPEGAAGMRKGSSPGPTLSGEDMAFAVAHGVFRAVLEGLLDADVSNSFQLKIAESGSVLNLGSALNDVSVEGLRGQERLLELGGPILRPQGTSVETRRALLVKIGHEDIGSLARIFADVITVDDRPTVGGALPDFWEASVARVVDRIERFPDIQLVAVLGKVTLGQRTVEKLREASKWSASAEELAYRTGLGESVLGRAAEKLTDHVKSFSSHSELVAGVAGVVRTGLELRPLGESPLAQVAEERFLRLRLEESEFQMPPETACSVETGAQAFPVVLERLRQLGKPAAVPDAAGVPMIDLIDFRILVREPDRDQVPGFYRKDVDALEDYYKKAFLDETDGVFARPLKDQVGRFIAHVADAITREPKPFSTRRAILVVPHVPEPVGDGVKYTDLSPLGLVSVRAIPKFDDGKALLHFSFTWRTVEALVGLPYSLYGSLRYSEHLADRIRQEAGQAQGGPPVQLADVSYIAHSLHVTTDDYGQNIARRIIHLSGE